jgi:phosphonoacetaldehyde hydrolase
VLLGHFHWPLSALNLSCAENVLIIFGHSNYMDIDSLERVGNLPENEIQRRVATTREILQKAGAHYVIDTFDQLPEVIDHINLRLKDGESP